ncbi:MAG TPA: hypothetical protein VFS09_12680 [Candidatus Eisenbacteria bacterium]|nr:hypothetical protein [Candidatus Eisenbacteria bacterium]
MIGKMPMPNEGPRPHLAALIEDMEAYRAVNRAETPAPLEIRAIPAPAIPLAVRRTPVSVARDPRFEPSVKPLVITVATFVLGLGGILFWMF